jgi:transcriptional regulator with XRE-family HTH domain
MVTLKQARGLVNLTQDQLAALSGVKKSAISDIETGRVTPDKISHGTVVRLVGALRRRGLTGLTMDELFPVDRVGADV